MNRATGVPDKEAGLRARLIYWLVKRSVGARAALEAAGLKLVPLGVGRDGLRVDLLRRKHLRARLAYVIPSHQFPLGVVLSLANRL